MPKVVVADFQSTRTCCWGLVASMYIGNAMLLILNLPLVGLFARMLDLPKNMLLSLVLGDLLEQAMRQSLTISDGSVRIFFTRPISLTLLIMAGLFMLWLVFQHRAENQIAKEQAA